MNDDLYEAEQIPKPGGCILKLKESLGKSMDVGFHWLDRYVHRKGPGKTPATNRILGLQLLATSREIRWHFDAVNVRFALAGQY